MVLTELLQNAVEHGFGAGTGEIVMWARRVPRGLQVTVDDDGRGLPEGFDVRTTPGLGLSIVRTLVESELDGLLRMGSSPSGGTRVTLQVPLP